MNNKYRQGDVILEKPTGTKRPNNILAYGEVTGHKHQITSGQATVYVPDDEMIITANTNSPAPIITYKPNISEEELAQEIYDHFWDILIIDDVVQVDGEYMILGSVVVDAFPNDEEWFKDDWLINIFDWTEEDFEEFWSKQKN